MWSTGFVGAKLGMPYAEPLTFLVLRFGFAALLMIVVALATRAPWPTDWRVVGHWSVIGVLIQGVHLGPAFVSMSLGMPAGIAALMAGLQPLATAVVAGPLLGERMSGRQWIGLGAGLAGVMLVLEQKLDWIGADLHLIVLSCFSVAGITAGTIYQKKFGGALDWRINASIQYVAATGFVAIGALAFEDFRVEWSGEFVFALAWLIVVLSLGAVGMLYLLIRRGAVSRVASLFYLVPPTTAVMAFFLFDETLSPLALVGLAVAVIGVALVIRD
jgi:drug/metabolite transporter (DMT)-like permease